MEKKVDQKKNKGYKGQKGLERASGGQPQVLPTF